MTSHGDDQREKDQVGAFGGLAEFVKEHFGEFAGRLGDVRAQFAADFDKAGQFVPERFEKLVGFLPGPQSEVVPYATLKGSLGTSEEGARAAVHKERRRFQACFDEIVLRTLDLGDDANDPERVKARLAEEKRALRAILDEPAEVVSLVTERKLG